MHAYCSKVSPDTIAVDALEEILGQKRGQVALDAAAVRPPDVALPVAQVARSGEHPPQALDLRDQRPSSNSLGRQDEQGMEDDVYLPVD